MFAAQAGGASVKQAITLAATAKDSKAVAVVVQHQQATEGMAEKLMDLHMLVGQPEQACEVAVARARAEQSNGNYKVRWWVLLAVLALKGYQPVRHLQVQRQCSLDSTHGSPQPFRGAL